MSAVHDLDAAGVMRRKVLQEELVQRESVRI
jgi:hypothetical protein